MLRIWTEHGFDVFFLWRWTLAVVGAVYTVLRAIQSLSRLLTWLEPSNRLSRIKGHYVILHLLRLRLRDFWWELLGIGLLLIGLIVVIRMHNYL